MAKRKQTPPSVNIDAVRWIIVGVIALVFLFLAVQAISAFLYHARTFVIRDIAISESLGEDKISDLEKMKGRNIFSVDLTKVEEKIRAQYPRVGGIKVVKRLPDQIIVTGFKREPVAVAVVGGRTSVVSRDGVFIGALREEQKDLPLLKGLKAVKVGGGTPVEDDRLEFAYSLIDLIRKDQGLSAAGFRSVDIRDPERVVCVFGEGKGAYEVFLDDAHGLSQLQVLSGMLGRTNLDMSAVKYIDLRFDQPVIGKKKTKK